MSSLSDRLLTKPHGVVAACTVGNAVGITPVVYRVFGFFLIPLTEEFGWSRSSVSLVLLIVAITSAASYPVIGRLIDRYGARRLMLGGNLLFAVSLASVSLIGDRHLQHCNDHDRVWFSLWCSFSFKTSAI